MKEVALKGTPEPGGEVAAFILFLRAGIDPTEDVSSHLSLLFEDHSQVGGFIEVITGEKIGKEFPVLKNRIHRLSEESGLTTDIPHPVPVLRTVVPHTQCCLILHFFASRFFFSCSSW